VGEPPFRTAARWGLVLLGMGASAGCPAQRGAVPMAGSRYPSTICVLGMRGLRVAVDDDDADDGSIDVTLTMSSDIDELRRRAHALVENGGGDAGVARPAPLRTPAKSAVDDVANGIRIRITPLSPHDLDALRAEVEDRVERASDPSDCP